MPKDYFLGAIKISDHPPLQVAVDYRRILKALK